MKKKVIITIISTILILIIIALGMVVCTHKKDNQITMGVWWWDDSLDAQTYLTFAHDNGVNEIYYCNSDFDDNTNEFIKKANEYNINVYWLAGEYQWIETPSLLHNKIEKYISFQANYTHKFSGVHLDIEPHQHPNFEENREYLITSFINLSQDLKQKYSNITFDYDIPFWLNDLITINNIEKPAYEYMIDNANRVFIMSYRDTAEKILDISKEELDYAQTTSKNIVLGVETKLNEYNYVSFYEEGKEGLNKELEKLKTLLPGNAGLCIHHIKSWYQLP